ncbi:tyrosine kinase receptor Cad96Ca isoform X2 [Ctenocephalides felis]|uniref:tyrosine kinase receptor Cad96Ca isoform X2 n=1 Tax=Ctenocephalides felis TaxID=7515 RepID=UPI000E6E5167|nr:tyrosine kinase receptor Cad96Ca isoform X2 [Ctenocephalides felis]
MEIHRINFATYVLAGLGLVPVILITVYVVVNLLNRAKKLPEDLEHCAKDSTPIANTAVDDDCDLYSVTSEYHFDRTNLRFKSILGEGNFGQVWKAEADDLTGHFGSTRIVAVKAERDEGGPGLRAEAEIMKKLGQHINVVTLLGLCMEQEPHLLIMEYAMRGRLLSLLRACKGPDGIREERDRTPPIANIQLTGFALDIAKGMEYIAARKIVHRDLAARNVLIDHNGVCKICDFGMSLDLGTAKVISLPSGADSARRKRRRPLRRLKLPESRTVGANTRQRPAMPIRWMAPESLQMHLYSTETDVWAFGVLLWEIFTLGCTPYPNLSGREVVRLVPSGLRLESPRRCCGTLLNLMSRCWKSDSAQRPTFAEARHDLTALHRAESAALDAMDDASTTDCFDVSGFSEDYENGVVYFDRRISEFECDI